MSIAVVCLVNDLMQADSIVGSLKNAGFRSSDISLLMPDTAGFRDAGYEKHSKAPEGASAGAGASVTDPSDSDRLATGRCGTALRPDPQGSAACG